MTEILRPMLYGSQHNIKLVPRTCVESTYQIVREVFDEDDYFIDKSNNNINEYVVVG